MISETRFFFLEQVQARAKEGPFPSIYEYISGCGYMSAYYKIFSCCVFADEVHR